jgi:dUTP pyrophosphatase
MDNIAELYLYVDPSIREIYQKHVDSHNANIQSTPYPNSGFDLFVPNDIQFAQSYEKCLFVDLLCKAEMKYNSLPSAYYIYPRSSMSKTPLMLANHTGIIDSGYRGNLIAAFRCLSNNYTLEKNTRIVQICHPSLCPIKVTLLDDETQLSSTSRGAGGFGSTGLKN